MKRLLLFAALAAFTAFAGENLNSIYLGEDVGSMNGAHLTAVQIDSAGTVTIYIGALVPGLHDAAGREVRVRRVFTVKP